MKSGDLISREEAIKIYCNQMCGEEPCNSCDMIYILENLPTAYDVEEKVRKIEELAKEHKYTWQKYDEGWQDALERAEQIERGSRP